MVEAFSRGSVETNGSVLNENEALLAGDTMESYDSITSFDNLNKNKKKNKYRFHVYVASLLLLFICTFIAISLFQIIPNAQDYVNQSVEVDIKAVELKKISTKGLDLKVHGLNVINYDNIDNDYSKRLFKLGGSIFQTADIKMESVDVQTIIDDKLISIGTIDIPNIQVNIGNGQTTEFNITVSLHPATNKVLGLIKELITHPDELFKIYGSTLLNIQLGYLPLGAFNINFEQEIRGDNYFQFDGDDMNFENLTINQNDTKYDIDFTLNIPNPIKNKLFAFHIPSLGWELFVQDCLQQPLISLFDQDIITDSFKLSPLDDILSVNISASISELHPKLQEHCSLEDNSTPLSTLVDQFINNKTLPLLLRNVDGSKEYPGFINELLKNIDFNFDYKSNFDSNRLIHNISIDHLAFEFKNGDVNKPIINGEINIFMTLPNGLTDFKINDIRGLPVLYHENVEFGKINLEQWHPCLNEYKDGFLYISFKLNEEQIQVTNKEMFGKVINEVLKNGSSKIFVDALLDCLISTLLGEFEIDKIHAQSESDITRGIIFKGWSKLLSGM